MQSFRFHASRSVNRLKGSFISGATLIDVSAELVVFGVLCYSAVSPLQERTIVSCNDATASRFIHNFSVCIFALSILGSECRCDACRHRL
jgi:hypothetical protein